MADTTISVKKDGNQWCALVGENLQEGRAGFGRTPWNAVMDLLNGAPGESTDEARARFDQRFYE